MTVRLKLLGFPDLVGRLGGDEIEVALPVPTVGALLEWLQRTHAEPAGTKILGADGRVDDSVQLLRNGVEWMERDRLDRTLAEGDQVTLFVLVAGG